MANTVATVPYIWEGVKGKKATKVKLFDLKARAIMDREITEKSIAYIELPQKPGNQISTAPSPGAKPGILMHKPANRYLNNAPALVQIRDRG